MLKSFEKIWSISIIKTLIFNFRYFNFKTAIKLPVFVYNNVILKDMKGKVLFAERPKMGSIKLGFCNHPFLTNNDKLIWHQKGGQVIFSNNILIGQGTYVEIGKNGKLEIGSNSYIGGGNTKLITYCHINIKANFRASWNIEIIDTSFHHLINYTTNKHNEINGTIHIGNNNWIGSHSKIYKNTITADFSTFGANSILFNNFGNEEYCVYTGNPPKIIKKGWYRDLNSQEV